MKELFPSLLKQMKWFKFNRNERVGDVMHRRDETAAVQTPKYARVVKVNNGTDVMVVRYVDIEYKLPGEENFIVTFLGEAGPCYQRPRVSKPLEEGHEARVH